MLQKCITPFQLCSSQQPPSSIMLQTYSPLLWHVPYVASSSVWFSVQDCGQQGRHIMTFCEMWWSGCPVENVLCEEQSWSQLQHLLCCTGQQGLKRLSQVPELPLYQIQPQIAAFTVMVAVLAISHWVIGKRREGTCSSSK